MDHGDLTPSRAGFVGGLVALGVALLAGAATVSAVFSRWDDSLDWSNYAVGLGATAVLLLVSVAAAALVRASRGRKGGRRW